MAGNMTPESPDAIFEMGAMSLGEGTNSHRTSRTKSDLGEDAAIVNRIGRPALLDVRRRFTTTLELYG
jgi:hypothetical protein